MLKDQRDLLCEFNAEGVEYLVVGGHAVNVYGVPRLTKDLDVFVRSNEANSLRVYRALANFGAPLEGLAPSDFCGHPGDIFQIGVEPNRVDVLQAIDGIEFDAAWERREVFEIDDGLKAPFLALEDLLANKRQSGRLQDMADVEHLTKVQKGR